MLNFGDVSLFTILRGGFPTKGPNSLRQMLNRFFSETEDKLRNQTPNCDTHAQKHDNQITKTEIWNMGCFTCDAHITVFVGYSCIYKIYNCVYIYMYIGR